MGRRNVCYESTGKLGGSVVRSVHMYLMRKPAVIYGDPRKCTFFVRWVSDVIL